MSRLKTDAIRNVNASVDGITLDTSGNVAIPNELQLADKIVHTGDTNTFIRFPANDTFSVETAGSERLRVHSNGNVTIGSASFDTGNFGSVQGLNVYGTQPLILVNATGNGTSFFMGKTSNACYFGTSDAQNINFRVSDADKMILDSSGRLLLGTTTEGRATYGEALTIAGSGHCGMTIRSGTTSYGILHFSDGTSGADEYSGMVEYLQGTNRMRLFAGGKYNIVLNGGGSTEINHNEGKRIETTSTGAILTSGAAGTTSCRFGNTANRGLEVKVLNHGNNDAGVVLNAADTTSSGYHSYIAFQTGGEEKARFEGQYDNFRLSNTCIGITFNGDYAAANALNDYEEGDFTLHFAVEGYSNASMSNRYGFYRKIGDIVHIWGGGTVANTYGSAAYNRAFEFKNLPFTPKDASGASNPGYVTGVFNYSNLDSTGISNMTGTAPYSFRPRLFNGNTHGRIEAYRSDSGQGSVNASLAFPTNAAVGLYLCYSI